VGKLRVTDAGPVKSIEFSNKVMSAPTGTNVKLWIYNPKDKSSAIGGRGIFLAFNDGEFDYLTSNGDGSFYATWKAGAYTIDVVEPNEIEYLRKRYLATVDSVGVLTIDGLTANSQGFYTLTVDVPIASTPAVEELKRKLNELATTPVSSFKPESACQLLDQITPNRSYGVDLSAGFPKVGQRLQSFGRIKALVVPVDFTDIIGKDNTLTYFSEVTDGVRDFYYKQSYGSVAFDFDIVPDWIRAPFASTKFGTGGSVGAGDPSGYLNALISLTDGAIDYSGYDAVYYLVPKEMPMANMGWGPAITFPYWISNGVIINGATGGADMYYVENNGIVGGRWKWMAHETGHAFGLYDEDLDHKSQSLGYWGIMAMSWSNNAIELGAWDRYLQGWLQQSQVNCVEMKSLTADGESTKISPIVRLDKEVKSIMVPVTLSKILVIESRKSESLDNIRPENEGVLVYTVDMKKGQLGGGYVIQKRIGSTDANFEDAALHAGDSITVEGVKITVTELSASGDTVKISKG
jgi:M6 family metalloprotease-like protein